MRIFPGKYIKSVVEMGSCSVLQSNHILLGYLMKHCPIPMKLGQDYIIGTTELTNFYLFSIRNLKLLG